MSDLYSIEHLQCELPAVLGLDDNPPRLDLRAALADARQRPWLYRLPRDERDRILMLMSYSWQPAAANALALDEEARRV